MIYNIFTIMVTNAFLPNLLALFVDFGHLKKEYKRSKLTKNPEAYDLTQEEANMFIKYILILKTYLESLKIRK